MTPSTRGDLETFHGGGCEGVLRSGEAGTPQRRRDRAERPVNGRHWLLVGPWARGEEVFVLGRKLPVFSSREEAEAFLAARAPDGGWRVEEFRAGELANMLHDSRSRIEGVALDPLPEAVGADGLVTVSREEFLSRGTAPDSPQPVRGWKTSRRPERRRETLVDENVPGFGNEATSFSAPVRDDRGVPVVEVYGEVDIATVPDLLEAIGVAGARMNGRPLAVVDLRNAEFIDVTGVRNLVEQAQALGEIGGELRLIVPGEGPVARVFEMLAVDQVQELYHDLAVPAQRPAGYDTSRPPVP